MSSHALEEALTQARADYQALLAENQQLREALERISTMPNKRDSIVNAPSVAIEALAGDAE